MSESAGVVVVFGWDPVWVSVLILCATYAVVVTERINRAIVALLGAGLMIVSGVLTQAEAIQGIDLNTIALLTGMMVVVAISRRSGVFEYVAILAVRAVRGHPPMLLVALSLVTAVFSALLDNVTTVLLVAPVTILVAERLRVRAFPFLVAEILASNIGGTATLIGDPPNIIIGSAAGLTFNDFLLNLAPVIVVILLVTVALCLLIWRHDLRADGAARAGALGLDPKSALRDRRLLVRSIGVMALIVAGFIMARPLGLEPGTIALLGAALLLLLDNLGHGRHDQRRDVQASFGEVEWIVIFFFVGLFIVVHGVDQAGVLRALARELLDLTGGDPTATALAILWGSAILSAIVDNIPFVATMVPLIKAMAPSLGGPQALEPLWWSLSLGACLGGNGTLIGASANLTVAGLAERSGQAIRFMAFTVIAFPLMLVSIAIATAYVYVVYLSG